MRLSFRVLLTPSLVAHSLFAQMPPPGNGGGMLQPAGDRTFANVLVASAVTPEGRVTYTTDIYLVKPGSTSRRLTTFDPTNYAPGATGVAISPDGTRSVYLALLNSGGTLSEELHSLDPVTGADRLLALNTVACARQPCWSNPHFSQDGTRVVWNTAGTISVVNYDGSGIRQLAAGSISEAPNVTTTDNRLIFSDLSGSRTIALDGSIPTQIAPSAGGLFVQEATISADGTTMAAEVCGDSGTGPNIGCSLSVGTRAADRSLIASFSGVSFSGDGSVAAWILLSGGYQSAGTLRFLIAGTVHSLATPAFDVAVSADGAKFLYSTGLGAVRGAVWLSDNGGNSARPLFAPRSISNNGITGLSDAPGILLLSPGSYFTIYGTNFNSSPDPVKATALPLPLTLAGLTVTVNGTVVPVQAVTPWQINALLPQSAAPGLAIVYVQLPDGFTLAATPTIAPTAPAIITYGIVSYAAVFHGGTAIPADNEDSPAVPGEVMASYGFGLGVTNPRVADGAAAPVSPLAQTAITPQLLIDGQPAAVTFSGLVPGLAGLCQINFVVPPGLATGAHRVAWKTGDSTGPAGIFIAK